MSNLAGQKVRHDTSLRAFMKIDLGKEGMGEEVRSIVIFCNMLM